jgi:hypothetical protein
MFDTEWAVCSCGNRFRTISDALITSHRLDDVDCTEVIKDACRALSEALKHIRWRTPIPPKIIENMNNAVKNLSRCGFSDEDKE